MRWLVAFRPQFGCRRPALPLKGNRLAARTAKKPNPSASALEACILAGGLSSRMGRDKSRVRLSGRTLLARVRAGIKPLPVPVRVIRRDLVPRCGPIGGIYTALQTSRAAALLFLPCDMPFLTPELLKFTIASLRAKDRAIFMRHGELAGFPCVFRREAALPIVERQIARSQFSLQQLAKSLRARLVHPPRGQSSQLANVNTARDLQLARLRLKGHKMFKHGLSKRPRRSRLSGC